MNEDPIKAVLEEYRAQRAYRQSKRDEFMRRFQILKQSFSQNAPKTQNIPHHSPKVEQKAPLKSQNHSQSVSAVRKQHFHVIQNEQQFKLAQQSEALKKQLVQVETEQRQRLMFFKDEIAKVKTKYIEDIKSMSDAAQKARRDSQAKMEKIKAQTEAAINKNQEIEEVNIQIKKELEDGAAMMGKYATQISMLSLISEKEYAQKIIEFEKVFNSSNEKILAMEKEFNEDEFVQNTLKNEELLKSIEQNAEKAEQASKILQDYQLLLDGKKQILTEIQNNTAMKEKEIAKMVELQGKIKLIMEKMTEEKKMYVAQNSRMASELIQIKNLLMGAMNQGQQ